MISLNLKKILNDSEIAPVGLLGANAEPSSSESDQVKKSEPQKGALDSPKIDSANQSTDVTSEEQPSEELSPNPLISNEDQNVELTNVSKDADSSSLIPSTSILALTVMTVLIEPLL